MSFVLNPPEPAHLIGVEGLEPAYPPFPTLQKDVIRLANSPRYRTSTHAYSRNANDMEDRLEAGWIQRCSYAVWACYYAVWNRCCSEWSNLCDIWGDIHDAWNSLWDCV